MFWMAWPAAPLTRLSTAAATTTVPVRESSATPTSQTFAPVTRFASGMTPGGSARTNGAPLYAVATALASASRSCSPVSRA
jgi:hypothetical protein